MAARHSTTNDNIRDLIDDRFESLRLELKTDIKDLSTQVSILGKTVDRNELQQSVSATKLGFIITAITIVASSLTTILIYKVTGAHL